jgi:hypothetical protein
VSRPAGRDRVTVPLYYVLVAKACAAHIDAASVDQQPIVEVCGTQMANVSLDRHRFDAIVPKRLVAASKAVEVVDARHLEPDEVLGVVRDALRVSLGEADTNLGVEAEPVDGGTVER